MRQIRAGLSQRATDGTREHATERGSDRAIERVRLKTRSHILSEHMYKGTAGGQMRQHHEYLFAQQEKTKR